MILKKGIDQNNAKYEDKKLMPHSLAAALVVFYAFLSNSPYK